MECWYKISYHLVKTESKRRAEHSDKKNMDFCGSILLFGQCPIGLHWSSLDRVRPSPAARWSEPATQTVRENMTSPLYHPLDTLEAHSSAGSNAPCSSGLMLTHK